MRRASRTYAASVRRGRTARPYPLARIVVPVWLVVTGVVVQAEPPGGVVMRAMTDEIERAMAELSLEGLPRPYFVQLRAQERELHRLAASYGGLTQADTDHNRFVASRVRVGSYDLDNTNFHRPFGAAAALPLDDDYASLRHTIWLVLDRDYKRAVEVYAAKLAYLESHNVEDRPDDFTKVSPVVVDDEVKPLAFDRSVWSRRLKRVSARFAEHPQIQDAEVRLFVGRAKQWLATSEGSKLFMSDLGGMLEIEAETQAPDGMLLYDTRSYLFESPDELPDMDKLLAEVDTLCARLVALTRVDALDYYSGPVLFEPEASGSAFQSLFADRIAAVPVPLGARWRDPSLQKKLGLRVLPRSFHVYDDPRPRRAKGAFLAGSYQYDDEGVPASQVKIVEQGKLKNLVAGRAPTRKVRGSTGHARSGGFGDPRASAGCLYVRDADGLTEEELREELIDAAKDEGLEYALRVESMESAGFMELGSPVLAYKVYTDDCREEPVRGLTFGPVGERAIKHILAGGDTPAVYNDVSNVSVSVIAPAVIFEELDLTKRDEEFDKVPILPPPGQREK